MDAHGREQSAESKPEEETEFVPRGITVFLSLMLILYAAYWAYMWFVVTIQRGVGG